MYGNRLRSLLVFLSLTALLVIMSGNSLTTNGHTDSPLHYDIRPLSDVYVDGPPQLSEVASSYAVLEFTSSIPLACSVVFGGDETYGQIAVDAQMAGTATTEHQPIMAGLQPQSTYLYRMQGTDANGIIYVSETFTFTTAPKVSQEENLAALAQGARITDVSSNYGGVTNDRTWGADSAIDENPATAWSSWGDGDDASIEVQLSRSAIPHAVDVWTRFMVDGSARITSFQISADNGEVFGPFSLPDAQQSYRFPTPFTAPVQRIRFDVIASTGGNTGLVEFAVHAPPPLPSFWPLIHHRTP